jgi:hypothetical protein
MLTLRPSPGLAKRLRPWLIRARPTRRQLRQYWAIRIMFIKVERFGRRLMLM